MSTREKIEAFLNGLSRDMLWKCIDEISKDIKIIPGHELAVTLNPISESITVGEYLIMVIDAWMGKAVEEIGR